MRPDKPIKTTCPVAARVKCALKYLDHCHPSSNLPFFLSILKKPFFGIVLPYLLISVMITHD